MIGAPPHPSGPGTTRFMVPAVASLAIVEPILAAPRPAQVLGSSTNTTWCALDDQVVLLSIGGIGFPNEITVVRGRGQGVTSPVAGSSLLIGAGRVTGRNWVWRVARWWDPTVRPARCQVDDVKSLLGQVEEHLVTTELDGLGEALRSGSADDITGEAMALLGRGAGLTPAGDDRTLGAVAAFRHVAASIGLGDRVSVLDRTFERIGMAARSSTTRLSATLLRCGFAGQVAAPIGDLLRAITGRGCLDRAIDHRPRDRVDVGSGDGRRRDLRGESSV